MSIRSAGGGDSIHTATPPCSHPTLVVWWCGTGEASRKEQPEPEKKPVEVDAQAEEATRSGRNISTPPQPSHYSLVVVGTASSSHNSIVCLYSLDLDQWKWGNLIGFLGVFLLFFSSTPSVP